MILLLLLLVVIAEVIFVKKIQWKMRTSTTL